MKIPWFGPPKWRHADPAVRTEAVRSLDDAEVLATLAETDPVREVRQAAVARLTDPGSLIRLAKGASDVAGDALAKLTAEADFTAVAGGASSGDIRRRAVARMQDRKALHRIATEDTDAAVRKQARAGLAATHPMRELLRIALSRLPVAPDDGNNGAEVFDSVDGVCDTLAADGRFRVHGIVGPVQESPATEPPPAKLEAVVSGATVLELLGNSSPEAAGASDRFSLSTYYHIEIRRRGERGFELKVTERESTPPFRTGGSNPPR